MSRLAGRFQTLRSAGKTALIPYITAGDPAPEVTVPLMHALVAAGADILELGIPFSDPMADGPVIQRAYERALAHAVMLNDVLAMVREFRQSDSATPVVLMGYLNPVEVRGYESFAQALGDAGVDGVITVDLPPEEADDVVAALARHDVDPIFLLAPTSTADRIRKITAKASGFVYYVSVKGVTGSGALDVDAVADKLAEIRAISDLPVGVGFGISNAESAAAVASVADAVVVGSALVRKIEEYPDDHARVQTEMVSLLSDMRSAIDATEKR